MATKYIDRSKGNIILLTGSITNGINTDVNGNIYNFYQSGNTYIDLGGGIVIVSSTTPSVVETWDDYAPYLLLNTIDNYSRHLVTANGDASLDGYGACTFDGTGDYLTVAANTDFDFSSENFTVEMFIKPTASDSDQVFFSVGTADYQALQIYWNSTLAGAIAFVVSDDGVTFETGASVGGLVSVGTEYHVELVKNGTSMVLYLDGVNVASVTLGGNIVTNNTVVKFGAHYSLNAAWMYIGEISRAIVYKGIAKHTSNFTPPNKTDAITTDAYTVLALDFAGDALSTRIIDSALPSYDDGLGAETDPNAVSVLAYDTSGNEIDFTVNGNPIYTSAIAQKLSFDGTGDYLSNASTPTLSGLRTYYWKGNYTKPITTDDYIYGDSNFNVGMDTSGYIFADGGTKSTFEAVDRSGITHAFALEANPSLFTASDDFGGTGYDSGEVGDTNYDIRWIEDPISTGTRSATITGGKAVLTASSAGALQAWKSAVDIGHAGDFDISVNLAFTTPGGASEFTTSALRLTVGVNVWQIEVTNLSGTLQARAYNGSSYTGWVSCANLNGVMQIIRVGTTVTFKFQGVTLGTGLLSADDLERIGFFLTTNTAFAAEAAFDDFVALDASSNPIYLPLNTLYIDGTSVGYANVGSGNNAAFGIGALNDGSSPIIGHSIVPMIVTSKAYEAGLNTLVDAVIGPSYQYDVISNQVTVYSWEYEVVAIP